MKTRVKNFQPKTKSVFLPKLRWRPKKKRSSFKYSPVFGPKLGEDQNKKTKKKGLHSNLVQFLAKEKAFAHRFCAQTVGLSYKGKRVMPQFRILFYANYTILATQRGGGTMAQCPPKKYAPEYKLLQLLEFTFKNCGL